jgi:prolyl oligopeptidase
VFIAHRKDLAQDGANPTLLHVYGGFNVTPSSRSISAATRRSSIAAACSSSAGVRGGSEYGEKWHEQAMLAQKQTTFDDTIAVAEWLVARALHDAGEARRGEAAATAG